MMNIAGSMNNTIGTVILAPSLCALSSSLVILSRRSSVAILRRAWLNGVPYCRLWLIMVPNRRSPSDVVPNFSNASRRVGNTRRSSRRPVHFSRYSFQRALQAHSCFAAHNQQIDGVRRASPNGSIETPSEHRQNQSRPHNSDRSIGAALKSGLAKNSFASIDAGACIDAEAVKCWVLVALRQIFVRCCHGSWGSSGPSGNRQSRP